MGFQISKKSVDFFEIFFLFLRLEWRFIQRPFLGRGNLTYQNLNGNWYLNKAGLNEVVSPHLI